MRFAAARFFPKIGRFSLKRENLQHCIPFRVASDSSRFFTLKSTQFLNGKNRKAACDFEIAPYFKNDGLRTAPLRGASYVAPREAERSDAVTWGAGRPRVSARSTSGRYGKSPQAMPRKRGQNDFLPLTKKRI